MSLWYTTDENSDTKLCINKGDLKQGYGKYMESLERQIGMDDCRVQILVV